MEGVRHWNLCLMSRVICNDVSIICSVDNFLIFLYIQNKRLSHIFILKMGAEKSTPILILPSSLSTRIV